MNIVNEVNIPTPPSSDLGFYEHTLPECVLTSTEVSQATTVPGGLYNSLSWSAGLAPSELDSAASWGTKTLPGAGPFYFANDVEDNPTLGHIDISNNEPIIE